ncbi:MAG: 2-oxoacid:ferredoxin oxidoreductase subunit beta [Deltaproteobacteria bacterium]|jgi:2-oxoglutarate ferredoxin oxidoreductase subunit beta|nr:2-oxoacid:ferredoxin oxidoreductase subunit beta [Deltaproteobacteria bacterium]
MTSIKELGTYAQNTWCPGCGNFGILTSIKKALTDLEKDGLNLNNVAIVSGIGCHAKIVDYINVNSFYSIHGRVPPPMTGIKLANPELTVIGFAGDGDAYGEGIEHLIFSAKRNLDLTFIVHNNRVYGLTTGQFTPTSPSGFKGRSTPEGSPEDPLNPIELMLSSGATFVARGYTRNMEHLQSLIKAAVNHKGFSFIDVLQPCFTFFNTYDYYNKRVYEFSRQDYDVSDKKAAFVKAGEWAYEEGEKIPIGIFYQVKKPTYEEKLLAGRIPVQLTPGDIRPVLEKHI